MITATTASAKHGMTAACRTSVDTIFLSCFTISSVKICLQNKQNFGFWVPLRPIENNITNLVYGPSINNNDLFNENTTFNTHSAC